MFPVDPAGTLQSFYMDKHLVTNREYYRYLNSSGYKPVDADNYLKHWHGAVPPTRLAQVPVVWSAHRFI